jgi:hypothetical protein
MRDQKPALYAASLFIVSCMALPSAENLSPGAVEAPNMRRYKSLPDISQITEPVKQKRWDFDSWASRLRAMREDKAGHRVSDSQIERHLGSWSENNYGNKLSKQGKPEFKRELSVASIAKPFQRLIELPLWQTSLLSAKYVMSHESDVVTYRERTFPTARHVARSSLIFRDILSFY